MIKQSLSNDNLNQFFLGLPSRKTIGIGGTSCVIIINIIIFMTAFSNYFTNYNLLVSQNAILPLDVCDKIIYMSLPALLLQAFIFSSIRIRMNYKPMNIWSIIHTTLLCLNIVQYLVYIVVRPYGCFELVIGIVPYEGIAEKAARFLDTLGHSNMAIYNAYNVQDTPSNTFVMIFASYLYIIYVLYVVIFLSATCDTYCAEQFVITLKQEHDGINASAQIAPDKLKKTAKRQKKK